MASSPQRTEIEDMGYVLNASDGQAEQLREALDTRFDKIDAGYELQLGSSGRLFWP